MNVDIINFTESKFSDQDYLEFLIKIYGEDAYYRYNKRVTWYRMSAGYIIIIAVVNGKIVGHASAYKTTVVAKNIKDDLWWGIDTFVLSDYRGKGIGKKLQLYLHNHCHNFSSVWYSPTNGIVKRKCGAKNIFEVKFTYYPVSKLLGVIFELAFQKIFHKKIILNTRLPYLYFHINKLLKSKNIVYSEIKFDELDFNYITASLKQYNFYIERSYEYMYWKYVLNPSLDYRILKIEKNGDGNFAYVLFTIAHECTYILTKIVGVKLLDIFSCKNEISKLDIILTVISYFKTKNICIDGILSLEDIPYFPKFIYPYPSSSFLSTMKINDIKNAYISYIDQDMEQMSIKKF